MSGTFYAYTTVVRYMVEVLNPQPGEKVQSACGSGGMLFMQTARYIHNLATPDESEQVSSVIVMVWKKNRTL